MTDETIYGHEDTLKMLDALFREEGEWWDQFYADKNKGIPFFKDQPDENLVEYFDTGCITPGKTLELGCGGGRNAVYLAKQGCSVDAADISRAAIDWGTDRAATHQVKVNFSCCSIFELELEPASYDLIYDSGCLHHIYPHRRASYLELVDRMLKPGGYFGLTCFAAGSMGAEITDWEVYRQRSMRGGLGYTEEKLKTIFSGLELIRFRRMRETAPGEELFGEAFLWTALFRKKAV
ncbi:class I SAM-dependent methyltransferase [Paenibacillus sp. MMS20-IR301]|uniref:class I SAM-dependent methyltransferase n=1 Tax=Paenibacillus sp. MMS20-IR301 TaxID=2895946 RepID=UPI0028E833BE|nr:class I SAM-dependent methyltransferase [Paenibacillus sp. MMS20-IR301]WNS41345.1 class I SAM-dependent methyltransferase [Paenibacillus sp. MMS20-IR301]